MQTDSWGNSPNRIERIEQTLSKRQPGLVVVLENVHDAHNVGAILRSCDAVGVLKVMMLYTIEQPPKIGKASASGALKWLEFKRWHSVTSCFSDLHDQGYQILSTKIEPSAATIYSYDLAKPTALVFGNEHRGISAEAAELSDGLAYIPMMGMVESVNVSVAAAIALFEAMRQRQVHRMYDKPQLADAELSIIKEQWLQK